jgi:hypothetical protein
MQQSNQHVTMAIIAVVVLVISGFMGLVGKSAWNRAEAQRQEEILEKAAQKTRAEQFEKILNTLLDDVRMKATAYKQDRKVLGELVQPINLEKPEYITENMAVMERLIASLRMTADDIMAAFEKADKMFKETLSGADADSQARLSKEWAEMTSTHIQTYVAFFAHEEKLMAAHKELMTFYAENAETMTYNAETDSLDFADENLAAQNETLRAVIKALYLDQAKSLSEKP